MHSFHGDKITIHHHGDGKGEIIINDNNPDDKARVEIRATAEDLIEFVAQMVLNQKLDKLENASAREILGLEPYKPCAFCGQNERETVVVQGDGTMGCAPGGGCRDKDGLLPAQTNRPVCSLCDKEIAVGAEVDRYMDDEIVLPLRHAECAKE